MYIETEAIILKQIKITDGRRIIVMLTEKYGKISAGTSIPEKGKNKSSLALRPFTRGRYSLYKNRDSYNINGAEVIQSFYSIGEDLDKYMTAAYVLEYTDKVLYENEDAHVMFKLLCDYLVLLSKRKNDFDTLLAAYLIKSFPYLGFALTQNPLLEKQSNDKISAVRYIETHSISELERLSLSENIRVSLLAFLKKYIFDNLGIEALKSESFDI